MTTMLLGLTWTNGGFLLVGFMCGMFSTMIAIALCTANRNAPALEEIFDRWRFPAIWIDPIVEEEHNCYVVVKRSEDGIIIDVENFDGEILGTNALDICTLSNLAGR